MTSAFSWQNSISLCPASFRTPRPNLPVTPGVSWLPTFAFQSPIMKRISFLGVSSRRSCRSSKNCSTPASSVLLVGAYYTAWNKLEREIPYTLMAESEEELKSLLMKVKERGEWKSWLKAQHLENEDHSIWSHHFMGNRWGNSGNSGWLYFGGLQNHCRWWLQPWNKKTLTSWKESYDQPTQHVKKQRHVFVNKGPFSQGYGFSSSHVWMWELDYKESWAPKNWCFWSVVLKTTLESPLDCKKIQPVHPKGDQSWVFIGRAHVEAKTPILRPPHGKSWFIWKDPDAGKDWGPEVKGMKED